MNLPVPIRDSPTLEITRETKADDARFANAKNVTPNEVQRPHGSSLGFPGPRLKELEVVIERGRQTFIEVGNALLEIRDRQLYRDTHARFEDYCRERWGWSRPFAYQLIDAAKVVSAIADTGAEPPANEAQARELVPLLRQGSSEEIGAAIGQAWLEAQGIAAEREQPVTATIVREAVSEQQPRRPYDPLKLLRLQANLWREHLLGELLSTAKDGFLDRGRTLNAIRLVAEAHDLPGLPTEQAE